MSVAIDRSISRSTLQVELEELGFLPVRGGRGLRRDGITVTTQGRWLHVATAPVARSSVPGVSSRAVSGHGSGIPPDLLRAQIGRPGLWRLVPRGNRIVRECELPSTIVDRRGWDYEDEGDLNGRNDAAGHDGTPGHGGWTTAQLDRRSIGPDMWRITGPSGSTGTMDTTEANVFGEVAGPLAASLSWLSAAGEERLPRGWYPPPRDQVESWLRPGDLVLHREAHTVRGELVVEPARLAFVFPILRRIPDELPATRLRWLDALVSDAQARWRFVRLGFAAGMEPLAGEVAEATTGTTVGGAANGNAVLAEVDLSGLPSALMESMTRTAIDSLRCVVEWLLAPAAVIADPRIESRLLDGDPGEI